MCHYVYIITQENLKRIDLLKNEFYFNQIPKNKNIVKESQHSINFIKK